MLNEREYIKNTCESCGRRNVGGIKLFSGMRLCTRCYDMLAPTDIHYGHFMW